MISPLIEASSNQQPSDRPNQPGQQGALGSTLRMLMWNTRKTTPRNWRDDVGSLCVDKELVLLQNVAADIADTQIGRMGTHCEWVASGSDQPAEGDVVDGVKTGCVSAACQQIDHYADQREAHSNSSRVLLETHYALGTSSQTLMVVNIHASTDASTCEFLDQLEQLCSCIDHHTGPIIVGGSFDTWSPDRLAIFQQYAEQALLFEASMTRQGSDVLMTQHLDYVFYREMSLRSVESLPQLQIAGYSPITATFVVD